MKIAGFEIFRYDLPLIVPLDINSIPLKLRSGFLVKISDQQGYSGIGEIAPLPGLHKETPEEALKNFEEINPFLAGSEIPPHLEELEQGFENWIGGKKILPSVRFGLEMAVLNLMAKGTGQSLGQLLSENCQKTIEINGLISGERNQVVDQARLLVREGYRTVKMKVGRKSIDEEIETVKKLQEIIRGKAQLRLDANRRWTFADAVKFAKTIGPENIEYVEEPLANLTQLDDYFDQTKMPFALDESLHGLPLDQPQKVKGLKVFVIKPSVIGGFERSMKLIRHAKAHGVYPVISSAFESGLALTSLANFAASLNPGNVAMGLDTYRWFGNDLLKTEFKTTEGKLDVELAYRNSQEINHESLSRITNH